MKTQFHLPDGQQLRFELQLQALWRVGGTLALLAQLSLQLLKLQSLRRSSVLTVLRYQLLEGVVNSILIQWDPDAERMDTNVTTSPQRDLDHKSHVKAFAAHDHRGTVRSCLSSFQDHVSLDTCGQRTPPRLLDTPTSHPSSWWPSPAHLLQAAEEQNKREYIFKKTHSGPASRRWWLRSKFTLRAILIRLSSDVCVSVCVCLCRGSADEGSHPHLLRPALHSHHGVLFHLREEGNESRRR